MTFGQGDGLATDRLSFPNDSLSGLKTAGDNRLASNDVKEPTHGLYGISLARRFRRASQ